MVMKNFIYTDVEFHVFSDDEFYENEVDILIRTNLH